MQATWILVADGVRARLFSRSRDETALTELQDFINPDGRTPERSFSRDRPTRTAESMGNTRHAIEPHTSAQEKIADRFAHELNDALERGRVDHRYERLVLAAPPRFLGALHHALGKQVSDCVVAHVNKDLTGLTAAQIQIQLAPQLSS